jgi:hypothetical protein
VPVHGTAAAVGVALVVLTDQDGLWGTVAAVAGLLAVRAVATLRHPPPVPVAPVLPPPVPPLPPRGSRAEPAVRRLDRVRDELSRLVVLVGPAGREVAEQAWEAAGEADTALRWQAARLAAVEPHLGVEPALLRELDEGVACQERLVAGMADLVAASDPRLAGAVPGSTERLHDAADALHGLACGLRALR